MTDWHIDRKPEAWRVELLRIYDEAYQRKFGKPKGGGGAKVPRQPKPKSGAPAAMLAP